MKLDNRRAVVAYAVAAALSIALLVGIVVTGWNYRGDRQVDQARGEVQAVASRQAVAMLAYEHATAKQELDKATDGLAGDFRTDYRTLVDTVIAPGAAEKQLTVKVDVRGTAVKTVTADTATVLVFLNQLTTSKDNPQAVITPSRVELDMRKIDGRWLITALKPV